MVAAFGATAIALARSLPPRAGARSGDAGLARDVEQTVAQRHASGWAPLATPAIGASRPAHRLSQEQLRELRRQITEQAAHESAARRAGER